MKLPNNFGSVYKLSGPRRNPWVARKTVGYKENGQGIYRYVGYYKTRKEAMEALTLESPQDTSKIAFGEIHDKWWAEHSQSLRASSVKGYSSGRALLQGIWKRDIGSLTFDELQQLLDSAETAGQSKSALKIIRYVFEYSDIHGYIPEGRYHRIKNVKCNIEKKKAQEHVPFSQEEIDRLWEDKEKYWDILILIYTGLRSGEFIGIKKEDINLKERYIDIKQAKTKAGVRRVPIAEKIVPLIENLPYRYSNVTLYKSIPFGHIPHDTRYTTTTLLTLAGVDTRLIAQILGHAGSGITEGVYGAHLYFEKKLEAINLI